MQSSFTVKHSFANKQLSNTLGKFSNFFIKTFSWSLLSKKMYYEQFITQEGVKATGRNGGREKTPRKKIITTSSICIRRIVYKS